MYAEQLKEQIQMNTENEKEALEIAAKTLQQLKEQSRAIRTREEYKQFIETVDGVKP